MPHDLFAADASRSSSARSRNAPIVSVAVHALVVAALAVLSFSDVGTLPLPRQVLAYRHASAIADIELPPRPAARAPSTPRSAAPAVAVAAAPVVAPEGIAPESGISVLYSGEPVDGMPTGLVAELPRPLNGVRVEVPPQPPPAEPVRLHQGIRAPEKVVHVPPPYPTIALHARREGIVILEATIDIHGNVIATTVLRSVPLFDAAAIEAVRQWKYTPALLNDRPVPVIMTVTVRFALQ
jgi:protein TonB